MRCWPSCPGRRCCRSPSAAPATPPAWYGASSNKFGSPQAEYEIPYGNVGQNAPYAQIAQRYAALYGYDPAALAKIAVDQRTNACAHPDAVFHGKPITIDDVLASPMIADPIHMLETVMRVQGGAGVLIANADLAARSRHRPVWIKGFGEHIAFKTPTYADDLHGHAGGAVVGAGVRDGGSDAGRRRRGVDLRLLHDHRPDEPGGCRFLSERRRRGVDQRPRPHVPRRLPAQHRGRANCPSGRPGWRAACTTSSTPPAR